MAVPAKKTTYPHGTKSQNPTTVYALLPLITEVISLKLILCILQFFQQSLNYANNSSSMALRGKKKPLVSWSIKLYLVASR